MKNLTLFTLALIFIGLLSCRQDELASPGSYEVLEDPENVELGRVLFYDKHLSINNTISCASCHKQQFAFADNVAFSRGFSNRKTTRNSPPIQFLGSFQNFPQGNDEFGFLFWDGRESDLTRMVLRPMVNHIEMGIRDVDDLSKKLNQLGYYPDLFQKTFGDAEINSDRISRALASFVGSIAGVAPIDMPIKDSLRTPNQEQLGATLFIEKYRCNDCHQIGSPSGYQQTIQGGFANIGLDAVSEDQGLGATTGRIEDIGKFKIPSLRNVAVSGPYMHDGRFKTLEEVIDHYSHGIKNNANLDFSLKNEFGQAKQFNITETEKRALISFLHMMTSQDMLTNPNFSNPFKKVSN